MRIVGNIISILLQIFLFALVGRLILDYVRVFARSWQPRGIILGLAELIYAVTDPVINFVRRFVPPLRLGPVALDLSFIVVFFVVQKLAQIVATAF
jgi:YggT family protein